MKRIARCLKGYRTVILNGLWIAIAILELGEWRDVVAPEYHALMLLASGICGVALRFLTTTPVGRRE